MSVLTRVAYQQLVDGDLEWLSQQPRTLEREHVELIVRCSVDSLYGKQVPGGEEAADIARAVLAQCLFGKFDGDSNEVLWAHQVLGGVE